MTQRWTQAQMKDVATEERAGLGLGPLDPLSPYALAREHGIPVYPIDDLSDGTCPPEAISHFTVTRPEVWSAALVPAGPGLAHPGEHRALQVPTMLKPGPRTQPPPPGAPVRQRPAHRRERLPVRQGQGEGSQLPRCRAALSLPGGPQGRLRRKDQRRHRRHLRSQHPVRPDAHGRRPQARRLRASQASTDKAALVMGNFQASRSTRFRLGQAGRGAR